MRFFDFLKGPDINQGVKEYPFALAVSDSPSILVERRAS